MLDIEALRLKPKDLNWVFYTPPEQHVADAQLKKAVWGIREWLYQNDEASLWRKADLCRAIALDIDSAMAAADIPKEGEGG